LEEVAYFGCPENLLFACHVSPAIHHKDDHKNHAAAPRFFEKPLKKRQFTTSERFAI